MKESKIHDENKFSVHGKEGKGAKVAGRAPLSNKTNKPAKKCHKLLQEGEDKSSLKLKKTSKKSEFTVLEDPAAKIEKSGSGPSRTVAVFDQQTQTESEQTQSHQQQTSDTDRLVADLCTAGEPSEQYWRQLAETRRLALVEALQENQQLQEENQQLQEALQENQQLQEALQENQQLQEARQEDQQLQEENQQLRERLAAAEEETRLLREVVEQAEGVMAAVHEWSEEQDQETAGH